MVFFQSNDYINNLVTLEHLKANMIRPDIAEKNAETYDNGTESYLQRINCYRKSIRMKSFFIINEQH